MDQAYAGGPHDEPLNGGATPGDGLDPKHASSFAFPLTFGCQTSLTGLFRTQLADGIMGMDNTNAAFWKQMYDQNAVPEQKFSLCFNRQPVAERDGTMAGAVGAGIAGAVLLPLAGAVVGFVQVVRGAWNTPSAVYHCVTGDQVWDAEEREWKDKERYVLAEEAARVADDENAASRSARPAFVAALVPLLACWLWR